MRRKIWLARNRDSWYSLFFEKPVFEVNGCWYVDGDNPESKTIIRQLCPDMAREWFLKRHIRKSSCVEGYFNVSFKPLKK